MKQGNIVAAYKVVNKLCQMSLPIKTSYELCKLKRAMQPVWDFQVDEERKIFDKYAPEPEENGNFKLKSEEEAIAFGEALKQLNDMEVEDIAGIEIPICEDIQISAAELESIDEFIKFTD